MSRLLVLSRRILAPLILGGLIVLVVTGWDDEVELTSALGLRLVAASIIGFLGLVASGISWARVSGRRARAGVVAFGSTLPLRHLPLGGLGQVAGLVGVTAGLGGDRRTVIEATPAFLASLAASAALFAVPVALADGTPWWLRAVILVSAAVGVALLMRGRRILGRFGWSIGDTDRAGLVNPIAWAVVSVIGSSLAFAALFPEGGSPLSVMFAFAASWLCGFLFVVSPAGLGVRESVLVLLFREVEPSLVVATALMHRLTTLVAEFLLFGLAWWMSRAWSVAEGGEV